MELGAILGGGGAELGGRFVLWKKKNRFALGEKIILVF